MERMTRTDGMPPMEPTVDYERLNALYAEVTHCTNHLNDTEPYLLAAAQGGAPVPDKVKQDRMECTIRIRECALEIARLEGREAGFTELDVAKERKKMEISLYDQSAEVNSFTLQGKTIWLPKSTRVGLANSIAIEKAARKETTTLWYDGVKYDLPIAAAQQMLSDLELYALACYNVTQQHLAAVDKLSDAGTVEKYNYKTGYPEKLTL